MESRDVVSILLYISYFIKKCEFGSLDIREY